MHSIGKLLHPIDLAVSRMSSRVKYVACGVFVLLTGAGSGVMIGRSLPLAHALVPKDSLRVYVSGICAAALNVTNIELHIEPQPEAYLLPIDLAREEMWKACDRTVVQLVARGYVWLNLVEREVLCYSLASDAREWLSREQPNRTTPTYVDADGELRLTDEREWSCGANSIEGCSIGLRAVCPQMGRELRCDDAECNAATCALVDAQQRASGGRAQ